MIAPIKPVTAHKEILRLAMKATRAKARETQPNAGVHAARVFFDNIELSERVRVGLYFPIEDELDTKPLGDALIDRGYKIALPSVEGRNAPLVFRHFDRGDPMRRGRFGVMTPLTAAPEVTPNIIITPLLAFDRKGARLGYGGGFYDRTLAKLRNEGAVLAVGFAFAAQEVDAAPSSPLDQPLDWIVTESGAIKISA